MIAISFEQYLLDNGFEPYQYNHKTMGIIPMSQSFRVSTNQPTAYYIKDNLRFEVGFHEVGFPPSLIYPRPKIKCIVKADKRIAEWKGVNVGDRVDLSGYSDSMDLPMSRVHEKYTDQEIYEAIVNNKTLEVIE